MANAGLNLAIAGHVRFCPLRTTADQTAAAVAAAQLHLNP
jgi:hypothetical protein